MESGGQSDKPPTASVLGSMSYRLDLVEKKTVEGATSCKTIISNLKELASAEDRHAKSYQKIQEALQYIPNIKNGNVAPGLKTWHSTLMKHAIETSTTKRRFAASLVTNVVTPLQDHVNQYRNQTRQVFFEMRSSYEVLVAKRNQVAAAKERYFKACKAADSAIRARNATKDKMETEIQAKKDAVSAQYPPLGLLEAKRDEVLAGLNQKIKAALDEGTATKALYIQADAACQSDRLRHQHLVADMLRKLQAIEVQREEHLQNQVFFRLASMYQDMVACLASIDKALFDESDAVFKAALDGLAHFSDEFKSPDDILTYTTDQMTNDMDTLAKLSDVFALVKTTFDAHTKRLQQIASSQSWALSDLDGHLLAQAWEKISTSVQVFAHIHGEYSNAIGGSITSVWKDLKAAHGHAKKQLAMMVQDIYMKRQGVQTNERDATQRYFQAKRELEAKQSQLDAVEREAVEEAKSPDKERGMSLVSLGWKDPAKVRLVKLKRALQEFEDADMATTTKQLAFAKKATDTFTVLYNTLVSTVHGDYITAQASVISSLTKISVSWQTACSVAETSQLHILHDVFASIEAIDPTEDLKTFVSAQTIGGLLPTPRLEPGKAPAALEFYTSELIEEETRPPPPAPAPVDPKPNAPLKSAELQPTHQVEFGLVMFYLCGLVALFYAKQLLDKELAFAQHAVHDQKASIEYLETMLGHFD